MNAPFVEKNFSIIVILKSTWDHILVKYLAVAPFVEKKINHKSVLQLTCYSPLLIGGGGGPGGHVICWEALVVVYYVFLMP